MFVQAHRLFCSRYVAVVLAAVLGTLAAIGAFLLVLTWEYRVAEIDFQSRAKSFLEVVNADLGNASTLLYTISAYFESNEHLVSRNEFQRFSMVLHGRVVGLRDTGWAPRVTLAGRAAFERDARAAGIASDYRISDRGPGGELVAAPGRPGYFPVLYIEAAGTKRHILGFDLSSEPERAKAVARALRTRKPAATPPIDVITTTKRKAGGILAFMAVRNARKRGDGDGDADPKGIVLGVFEIVPMLENIFANEPSARGLDLYLFNRAGTAEHRLIYWRPSSLTSGRPPAEHSVRGTMHWQGTVHMVDQRWGAIVTPTKELRFLRWSWRAVAALVGVLTMTAMIAAYLPTWIRRSIQLEALTEQIAKMARHDALTGLPNRVLFRERMEEAVARCQRDERFAVLGLDLDQFKAVNDTLGHAAGDRLLCAVAQRIEACLRKVDTAARLGGDEFAIILAGTTSAETIALVAGLLIREVSLPYVIEGHTVVVGASIGVAIATTRSVTAEGLLKEADLALYQAKEAGRGTFCFFEARLRTRIETQRLLEHDLRLGLERCEFELHYQPFINLAQNRVTGFEALVRWNHPARGLIAPGEFISLAEERGLIVPLGLWVLKTACEQAAHWPAPVKVAVNISPVQLKAEGLVEHIQECLAASGLPPERLEIEITEAAVLQESSVTLELLDHLRALGVVVAFDDFGTGFSSLSSVLRFPFDKIKIDRSFVADIETSPNAAAIVRAVTGLGANLGLVTTGEGVETLEQLACLRRSGCTEAQGYLFSPARPNCDVPQLLITLDAQAINAVVA